MQNNYIFMQAQNVSDWLEKCRLVQFYLFILHFTE